MRPAELSYSQSWEIEQRLQEVEKRLRIRRVQLAICGLVRSKTNRVDVIQFAEEVSNLLEEEYADEDFNVDDMGDDWAARFVLRVRARQTKELLGFWSWFRRGAGTAREFVRVVDQL